jgi:hypothetical protein
MNKQTGMGTAKTKNRIKAVAERFFGSSGG